jgi:feruloyl esterase
MPIRSRVLRCSFTIIILFSAAFSRAAEKCENLSTLKLPDTTITSAQIVAAGAFTSPTPAGNSAAVFKGLPAFCRVTAEIKPVNDSDIKIEVWMPVSGWNGRYRGIGNGGFAGSIGYPQLAIAVGAGDAAAATDTGHSGSPVDASWALGHPERIVDFGYRAIHEMTLKAKAVMKAFYGEAQKHSYFGSCSNGGRQALMEAQRYPEDYDGLIAGAPAYNWTHLLAGGVWNSQATLKDAASYISPSKIPALEAAVLAACDSLDGVKDGILNNPKSCSFDPASMLCKQGDSDSCLTAAQVTALKKIYSGTRNSKGQQILPGFLPGGEGGRNGWATWITGSAPGKALAVSFGAGFMANMVFDDAKWDFKTFNFDSDMKRVDDKQAHNFNATDPDLRAFKSHGGKLIIYHGWSDAGIPPQGAIDYFSSMARAVPQAGEFARLYMIPGMQHCSSGPGTDEFLEPGDPHRNMYLALEQWVENGIAPGKLIASKKDDALGSPVKMTRPLCPWPQESKYKGKGDADDQAN